MKKLVIFDLDGTLLNTIADLATSTNHALSAVGFPTHHIEDYNFMVGNGINKLFERALPEHQKTEENILKVRKEFLIHYNQHNMDKSTPYPGIENLLHILQNNGIMLAVASNKYNEATVKLAEHFFPNTFNTIYGQRSNVPTKPDPHIVYTIMEELHVSAEDVLYVGDSGVDMQTALNAKVTSCGVTWGFRPRTELEQYTPDYIVSNAEEIANIILKA